MNVDLFAVGGQSNAVGRGDSSTSPNPNAGEALEYVYDTDTIVDPLDDPVDGNNDAANTGSAWPKFCVDYYSLLSQPIAIVGAAKGGSAQVAAADSGNGDWDTGSLDEDLISYVNAAISKLEGSGHTVTFRGILWHQGERDAQEIDSSGISKSDYKTALQNMISRFRTEFGSDMPMWIFELGRPNDSDTAGFQDVRAAQREVVLDDQNNYLISDRQKEFPSLGYMADNLHYDQAGLNLMGSAGALNVASRVSPTAIFQAKRGTESQNDSYAGAAGEPTVNETDNRLVIHDGATTGGIPVKKESELE